MKRILILISILLGLLSLNCVKPQEEKINIDNLLTTELTEITVPDQKIAIVTRGIDTLGILYNTQSILLPKSITRSSTTKVEYIDIKEHNNLPDKTQLFQVVAFEDSKSGDYDYNDLVIQTKVTKHGNNGSIEVIVHPIALGAAKDFGVGVTIKTNNGSTFDKLLYSNCREELFNNKSGFINTANYREKIDLPNNIAKTIISQSDDNKKNSITSIDWYLLVGNEKYYAVSKTFNYLDKNKHPYGLIFTNIRNEVGYDWWDYPQENVNIQDVYDFNSVFKGKSSFNAFNIKSSNKFYPAINDSSPEKCLYKIKI